MKLLKVCKGFIGSFEDLISKGKPQADFKNFSKILVLLTHEFPYGFEESFLENEIPFLSKSFCEIIILTDTTKGIKRTNLKNIRVIKLADHNLWHRLVALSKPLFRIEIVYLFNTKRLNKQTFKTSWYYLTKAVSYQKQLNKIHIQNINNKVIYYSYWLNEKSLSLSLFKRKIPSLKIISRAHGWDLYEERQPYNFFPFRDFLLQNLTNVFAISENGKKYLIDKYPNLKSKFKTSKLGILPLNLNKTQTHKNSFHILSISSFVALKRVERILDVVSLKYSKPVHWTHIGSGPLFKKIKEMAINKRIKNPKFNFEFLGRQNNSDVKSFLSNNYIDLFINLSDFEGIPVSIMEAQSAAIPVLATDVGGVSEIVSKNNGILVDKNSTEKEIYEKLMIFLNDSESNKIKKKKNALENFNKKYTASKNYNSFIDSILK